MDEKPGARLTKACFVCICIGFIGSAFLLTLTHMFNAWRTIVWEVWLMIALFTGLFLFGLWIWLRRWRVETRESPLPLRVTSILFMTLGLLTLLGLVFMGGLFIMMTLLMAEMGAYPAASPIYLIGLLPLILAAGYFHASLKLNQKKGWRASAPYLALCVFGAAIGAYLIAIKFPFSIWLTAFYVGLNVVALTLSVYAAREPRRPPAFTFGRD